MSRVRIVLLAALVALVPARAHALDCERIEILQQSVKTSGSSFVTGFGVRTHLGGDDLNAGFKFVPGIEYWQKVVRLPDLGVHEVRQSDWRIGGDLRFGLGDGSGWTPFAGPEGLVLARPREEPQTEQVRPMDSRMERHHRSC